MKLALVLLVGAIAYLYVTQLADQTAKLEVYQVQNLYTRAAAQAAAISADAR